MNEQEEADKLATEQANSIMRLKSPLERDIVLDLYEESAETLADLSQEARDLYVSLLVNALRLASELSNKEVISRGAPHAGAVGLVGASGTGATTAGGGYEFAHLGGLGSLGDHGHRHCDSGLGLELV